MVIDQFKLGNKVNFVFKVCSAEVRVEIQAWFLSGKKVLLKSWAMCLCFCNAVSNRENTDKTMKTLERQGASPVSTVSVEVQTELEPWSARCFFATFLGDKYPYSLLCRTVGQLLLFESQRCSD